MYCFDCNTTKKRTPSPFWVCIIYYLCIVYCDKSIGVYGENAGAIPTQIYDDGDKPSPNTVVTLNIFQNGATFLKIT